MKPARHIIILALSMLTTSWTLWAKENAGSNTVKITAIEKTDEPGKDICNAKGITLLTSQELRIKCKNADKVKKVKFDKYTATLKAQTDTSFIIRIPSVAKKIAIEHTDGSIADLPELQQFNYEYEETPRAYMFYNEFVPDGGTLRIMGCGFSHPDDIEVEFDGKNGKTLKAKGGSLRASGDSYLWVRVPKGVAENAHVRLKNTKTGKSSVAPMLLRDTRNMLMDFENYVDKAYSTGDIEKHGAEYSIRNAKNGTDLKSIAENYHSTGSENNYGIITSTEWKEIAYSPDHNTEHTPKTVFGAFENEVVANPPSAKDYVVKFEINIPAHHAINQLGITLAFTAQGETTMGTPRQFCATLQPSAITWDKTGNDWKIAEAKDFYTDGWMTVTVPMNEFMWNMEAKGYTTSARELTLNGSPVQYDIDMYGDPIQRKCYADTHMADLRTEYGIYTFWGGFVIMFNPYDGPSQQQNDGKMLVGIDNLRIVPNDGNGAIYPKTGWGQPSQHFYDAPCTNRR